MTATGFTTPGIARMHDVMARHVAYGDVAGLAWAVARVLKALGDELAQLVDVELGRVDDEVGNLADGRHETALLVNALADGELAAERMGAARLRKTADEGFVARLDKDQRSGMLLAEFFVDAREACELAAFASIHEQGGALNFSCAFGIELAELGDEVDGQVIHAIKAEVFESAQHRALAGAAEAGKQHELAETA